MKSNTNFIKNSAVKAAIACAAAGMIMCAVPAMADEVNNTVTGVSFEEPDSWHSDRITVKVDGQMLDDEGNAVCLEVDMFGMPEEELKTLSAIGDTDALLDKFYPLFALVGINSEIPYDSALDFVKEYSDGAITEMVEFGSSDTHTYYLVTPDVNTYSEKPAPDDDETSAALAAVFDDLPSVFESISYSEPVPDMGTPEGAEISFETTDLDGNPVSSTDLFAQHRITLVNLWFSGCPICIDELPDLERINQSLKEKGCAVVGMTVDAVNDAMIEQNKGVLAENGVTYLNLIAPDNHDELFSCKGYPTSYLVDQNGRVIGQPFVGPAVDVYESTIDSYLAEMEGGEDELQANPMATAGMIYGKSSEKNILAAAKKAAADPFQVIVKDEDGNPVEGAFIQFCSETVCMLQYTGPDGKVTFDRDTTKDCKVHVLQQPEGFAEDSTEYPAKGSENELEIVLKK